MFVENVLDQFEEMVDNFDDLMRNSPNLKIIREVRAELRECGMHPSYRDQFVAVAEISVTGEYTDEQWDRMIKIARKMVRVLYTVFHDEGFNDQAIALMGRQFSFKMES